MTTNQHCCSMMRDNVNFTCPQHPDLYDCGDFIVRYLPKFDEYGIVIHDGGTSAIHIDFCPWCGTRLPESKRDLWFDTLEAMGFDEPLWQDIPEAFQSDRWYREE